MLCNMQFLHSKHMSSPTFRIIIALVTDNSDPLSNHKHMPMGLNLYLFYYMFQSSEFDTNKTLLYSSHVLHIVVFLYFICWLFQTDITGTTTVVQHKYLLKATLNCAFSFLRLVRLSGKLLRILMSA